LLCGLASAHSNGKADNWQGGSDCRYRFAVPESMSAVMPGFEVSVMASDIILRVSNFLSGNRQAWPFDKITSVGAEVSVTC
jgi:hypothetical protein